MKRGDLNRHSGIGGSLTSVIADLQAIWSWVINVRLGIPLQDLKVTKLILFYFKMFKCKVYVIF